MPITPRTRIPYPSEDQDPFFDDFEGMIQAVDASLYAEREDRQTVLMDGGLFTWNINPTTQIGTLTWAGTINLSAPITGFKWFLTAGNVQLLDGEVFYVTLPRAPLTNLALVVRKGSQVPSTDADLIVGIRSGSHFYFRNGRSLQDGDSTNILEITIGTGGGGGGLPPGANLRENIPIAMGQTTTFGTFQVAGDFTLDANDYVITGTTLTTKFKATGFMTGGATGQVILYDITAAAQVAGSTLTFSSPTPGEQFATVTLPLLSHVYEVRIRVSAGVGAVFAQWAGLEIVNTF